MVIYNPYPTPTMPTNKALRAGEEQIAADFDAAMKQFCIDAQHPQYAKKIYCLGIVMTTLALKQFVEVPESNLLPGMDAEDSMEAYYEAARKHLHAD